MCCVVSTGSALSKHPCLGGHGRLTSTSLGPGKGYAHTLQHTDMLPPSPLPTNVCDHYLQHERHLAQEGVGCEMTGQLCRPDSQAFNESKKKLITINI